jgi:glycosyltransferase involved in cell wall biosynthesis
VLSRFVEKRSKKIIAISETVRNFLVTNQEARREHIVVVRYGFDSEIDYGKGGSQFSDGEIFHIGTVSRLVPQKDLGTLLKAFSILERNFPSSKLSIVGAGPDELKLKEEAENLGISSKTHWLGRITNPLEFMSKLDAYVMTSIYEGFGLVVLEAISQRVPVILSDIPTFRELFSENSEEFFPVGDHQKLASILINMADKQSRARALDSQIKTLSNFSPNKMIEDMENVYVGVLK